MSYNNLCNVLQGFNKTEQAGSLVGTIRGGGAGKAGRIRRGRVLAPFFSPALLAPLPFLVPISESACRLKHRVHCVIHLRNGLP